MPHSKTGQGRRSNKAIGPRKKHKQPAVLNTTNVTSLEDPNPDFAISKAASIDTIMDDVNVFDMSGVITEALSNVVDREVESSIVITEALSDVADREVESSIVITEEVADMEIVSNFGITDDMSNVKIVAVLSRRLINWLVNKVQCIMTILQCTNVGVAT